MMIIMIIIIPNYAKTICLMLHIFKICQQLND